MPSHVKLFFDFFWFFYKDLTFAKLYENLKSSQFAFLNENSNYHFYLPLGPPDPLGPPPLDPPDP